MLHMAKIGQSTFKMKFKKIHKRLVLDVFTYLLNYIKVYISGPQLYKQAFQMSIYYLRFTLLLCMIASIFKINIIITLVCRLWLHSMSI